jgi:hypothetical protein
MLCVIAILLNRGLTSTTRLKRYSGRQYGGAGHLWPWPSTSQNSRTPLERAQPDRGLVVDVRSKNFTVPLVVNSSAL